MKILSGLFSKICFRVEKDITFRKPSIWLGVKSSKAVPRPDVAANDIAMHWAREVT